MALFVNKEDKFRLKESQAMIKSSCTTLTWQSRTQHSFKNVRLKQAESNYSTPIAQKTTLHSQLPSTSKYPIFVGDTLFAGSIGRTDLYGGSYTQIISSIKTRLFTLEDHVIVYPGHGTFTTIGEENNTIRF